MYDMRKTTPEQLGYERTKKYIQDNDIVSVFQVYQDTIRLFDLDGEEIPYVEFRKGGVKALESNKNNQRENERKKLCEDIVRKFRSKGIV